VPTLSLALTLCFTRLGFSLLELRGIPRLRTAAISVVSWIARTSRAFYVGLVPRKLKGDPVPLVDPLALLAEFGKNR
jgi:hypothetical protein